MTAERIAALELPAALLVAAMSLWLLVSHRWRTSLVALAFLYLGVFILVANRWPLAMSAVKLVAGWMALAILGAGIAGAPLSWQSEERFWPSGRFFRFLLAILMGLAIWSVTPRLENWLPAVDSIHVWGGAVLIGMGLLHLALTAQPLRATLALLTILAGFEVLYAALESSVLVAALLATINLGVALVGAYLLNLSAPGETA
ncbi:MAG: hypothetical protein ACOYYS_00040 [Chloroflexota bacterium]